MKTAILVLSLAACGGGGASHADGPVGSDGSASCGSNTDCTGASASVCDTSETPHACVECTSGDHAACTGTTPVCTSDSCGACTMDNDCVDSGVCMPDGSCAAAADVIYSSVGGTGTACTETAPCTLMTAVGAVAGAQNIVHLDPGHYLVGTTLMLSGTATLVGRGATIDRNAVNGRAIQIADGSTVTLDFVEVTGGNSAATGYGIDCGAATVTLNQVTIDGNVAAGLNTNATTLTVSRSTFTQNSGGGIVMNGAASTFTITNNFIYRNGDANNATTGGATLLPSSTSIFAFNTVVDNQVKTGGALAGGVACDQNGFSAPNNIIARNEVNGMASAANANTNSILLCTFPTAVVATDLTSLALASPDNTPYDYHLTSGSTPAIDQATADAAVKVDVDGDSRPQGSGYDIGADELKQP